MKVIYVGPYKGVEVALPSGGAVYVERGAEVELYDEVAESLLQQEDIWADPTASAKQKPPAPSKRVQEVAAELGVDLDQIEGTGSKSAITVGDVKAAAATIEAAKTGADEQQEPTSSGDTNNNSAEGAQTEEG
jgi:pyruvate/2-oxoglutarate dehydrogenase complex dihydrolipoamide acyltransferase (E2) component